MDIKYDSIFKNLKEFGCEESINRVFSVDFFQKNVNKFLYYFDKYKLYEEQEILYYFINNLCFSTASTVNYKFYFEKLDYSMFLRLVENNIEDKSRLIKIVRFFPLKYIIRKETIDLLASSRYLLCSLFYFKRLRKENYYNDMDKVFSFIPKLSIQEIKKYIKPNENTRFIKYICENVNNDYFNDLSFAVLFLPFKYIFKEKIPFNIKRLLIDEIYKEYKSDCLDVFEGEYNLLTVDEISKLFNYINFSKKEEFIRKLKKENNPLFLDSDKLTNFIIKNPQSLNFISLEDFSLQNLELMSSKINIQRYEKKVRIHQKINGTYKFEYTYDEILPNGEKYSNFTSRKMRSELDEYLFEFLICSSDIEIIYDNYYEKYKSLMIKKYGKEKFDKIDDIYNFLRFILVEKKINNEIVMPNLEMIYQKLSLTNAQINHIKDLMSSIDPSYNEKINRFLMRQRTIALSKYNAIVRMHLDGVNVSEALSKIGLSKDELIAQIIKMRNLDKKEKKSLINLLKEEKYVITIGDILAILQEMEENDYTIDEVLRLNGINKKYFYTIYKELIYTNPELHKKIKEALLNNKKRGFKKYIKLAYYITTLEFNDEEDLKNMFPNIDLDEMTINMEKLGKINIVTKLKEIKQNIKSKTKQIN